MLMRRMVVMLGAFAGVLLNFTAATADEKTPPDAADQKIQASILIVDSHDAIAAWVKDPKGGDSGRMRVVTVGQKIFVPVVVTGLKTTEFGQPGIVADMQFVLPDGKIMFNGKKCCSANRGDPRTPGLVVLNPVLDLTSEQGDPLGAYEIRATVTYDGRSASASEKFVLQAGTADKAVAKSESGPAVVSAARPHGRSRGHRDARTCLDAANNAAVIRCAEKYR